MTSQYVIKLMTSLMHKLGQSKINKQGHDLARKGHGNSLNIAIIRLIRYRIK